MSITRRQWLQTVGGAAVGLAGRTAQAVFRQAAAMRLGFSLYGMKSLPLMQSLKICADIGYSGVELPVMPDWPAEPAQLSSRARINLRKQLQDLSLDLLSLMDNLPLLVSAEQHKQHQERLKAAGELAHDLSPDAPPLVETVLGGRPETWNDVKERMVDLLGDWEQVVRTARVVLAVKPHVFNALHTPEDARWLVRQIDSPWVKLAFDYSHFERQQRPLAECLQAMLPDTVFVHVKDNVQVDGKTEFALPGEGTIDYAGYMQRLKAGGYRGPVVVEVSAQVSNKPGYNPVIAAERSYLALQPAFEKVGLRIRT